MSKTELRNYETLHKGEKLSSPDNRFHAILQDDGNFVIYGPIWSSNTHGNGQRVVMQNGNLLIYTTSGDVLRARDNGGGSADCCARVTDDGHLVIVDQGRELWRSDPKSTLIYETKWPGGMR
ncbi:B-type lectin plumieribetin-like [Engraulis encrasicolus]|uniref:B-type lectin plumieribetin-like n=1 Tax=Engraulis encrasicolus TaxID=184585 RepID=UPI002FD6F38E